MRTLIDTSFVVALITHRDENHEKAVQLSVEFDRQPTLITDAILLEVGNSLAQEAKEDAVEAIEGFFK